MDNGLRLETVKRNVAPFQHGTMTLTAEYFGRVAMYENGKRIFTHRSPIRRISRGAAMADARMLAHDLAVTKFFNESTKAP